jgi:hypothetical protein
MGGKQKRSGQHILLFTAACLIFLIGMTGCGAVVRHLETGPATSPDRQENQFLDQAEIFLQQQEYVKALDSVNQAISCCTGRFAGRAFHIMGIALAASDYPMASGSRSFGCFRRLDMSFSDSVYRQTARCWADALDEVLKDEAKMQNMRKTIQSQARRIQGLERQIEQLKDVDLEPETPQPGGNSP